MRNAGLEEAQAGIKQADDTTLMAESKELKSLLMNVQEESEKASSWSPDREHARPPLP